jgi:hypothetical protein
MLLVDILRPATIVELGTDSGVSYCAFCQAVQLLDYPARCFAIDHWRGDGQAGFLDDHVLEDLRAHHDVLYGGFSRLIQSSFDEALVSFQDSSIDLLHIDGYHSYESVRHDFETWLPKVSRRGVILFHDTAERRDGFGVWQLWEESKINFPHFEFAHGHGLGVLAVGGQYPRALDNIIRNGPQADAIRALFSQLGAGIEAQERLRALLERESVQQEEITSQQEQITSQQEQITAQQEQITALEAVVIEKDRQLDEIHRGRGWRIIQGYRWMRTHIPFLRALAL